MEELSPVELYEESKNNVSPFRVVFDPTGLIRTLLLLQCAVQGRPDTYIPDSRFQVVILS